MIMIYEEINIVNQNESTRAVVVRLGKYLERLHNILEFHLTVDGKQYNYDCKPVNYNEIHDVCSTFSECKEIRLSICMTGEIDEIIFGDCLNNIFLKPLQDDLKKYVRYKAIYQFNFDLLTSACVFDENGLSYPDDFTEDVPDIEKWYCHIHDITIRAEAERNNDELYNSLKSKLDKLSTYCDAVALYDEWKEYGTFEMLGSITLCTKDIPQIVEILQGIKEEVEKYESGHFSVSFSGVPDGENDYDFAIVRISDEPDVKAGFMKF